jgi:hypothetical protein
MPKASAILILLLTLNLVVSKTSHTSTAIAEIVREVFVARSIHFDFIAFPPAFRNPHNMLVSKLLLNLVNEISQSVRTPAQVRTLNSFGIRFHIDKAAVLIFPHLNSYTEYVRQQRLNNKYPKEFHFFVYIKNLKRESIDQLDDKNGLHIQKTFGIFNHLTFVLEFEGESFIELMTFIVFQQPKCRDYQPVVFNRYSKATRTWENQKFTMEKFRNLNKCELAILKFHMTPYMTFVQAIIQEKLNFSTTGVYVDQFLGNKTNHYDFLFRETTMREIVDDLAHGGLKRETMTHYIVFYDRLFYISRSPPLSFLEKALLPFDDEVWYWLIGFLVVGVAIVVAVNFASRKIRNFVIGLRVKAPLLNLV